jgi:ATP-GRASP peptide maturase of grasp-with-spasm system
MNKKIIILSENNDLSTNDIMRWCKIKGYDARRINYDDRNLQIHISESCINICTSFDSFSIEPNSACWFRRADLPAIYLSSEKNPVEQEKQVFSFSERKQTYNALKYWIINHCHYSCEFFHDTFNKIDVLLKAQKSGIKTPQWIVTDHREYAISFAKQYQFIASKPFTGFALHSGQDVYTNLTERFTPDELQSFSPRFVSRIFQQYIEKKYELRSFYFHEKFFTYAILSQNNPKTAIDFRNYDNDTPNRSIPFELPEEYKMKLTSLMKQLKLDTGSFDILVDRNDDYYFLEVNPVGQFGYGSYECNLNIEEYIANHLISLLK